MSDKITCGSLAGTVNQETGEICSTCEWNAEWWMWSSWCVEGAMTIKDHRLIAFCPHCGARLSFDASGNPVAVAQAPMEALEWLAKNAGGDFNDCPVGHFAGYDEVPDGWCEECEQRSDDPSPNCKVTRNECGVEECWVAAALFCCAN